MTKTGSRQKSHFFIVVDFSDGEKNWSVKSHFLEKDTMVAGGGLIFPPLLNRK